MAEDALATVYYYERNSLYNHTATINSVTWRAVVVRNNLRYPTLVNPM